MRVKELAQLVDAARRQTGLEDFHSDSFREGLGILLSEINRIDAFTPQGVDYFEKRVTHFLATRLKVDAYIAANPDVLEAPITAPLVVLGLPRTGSTLLNNLLATDHRFRSPLSWEFEEPIPPPTSEELHTGPRAMAALEAEAKNRAANPQALSFRPTSAVFPVECAYIHAQDFKSLFWEAHAPLPAYSEWMVTCDMASAYEYERRFLQVLQHKAPGVWNLKMPSHAVHIEALLKAFPDARIIWTHRDPFSATASLCGLIANTHKRTVGEPDTAYIGANYPRQLAMHVDRVMAARARIPAGQLFDHAYADIVRDPVGAVRKIYGWLGMDFGPQVEAGITQWLADNPQGKWVTHAYKLDTKLDEFGLSVASLRPFFANYLAKYEVESEAAA